jgi:hypothetical protein
MSTQVQLPAYPCGSFPHFRPIESLGQAEHAYPDCAQSLRFRVVASLKTTFNIRKPTTACVRIPTQPVVTALSRPFRHTTSANHNVVCPYETRNFGQRLPLYMATVRLRVSATCQVAGLGISRIASTLRPVRTAVVQTNISTWSDFVHFWCVAVFREVHPRSTARKIRRSKSNDHKQHVLFHMKVKAHSQYMSWNIGQVY